MLLHKIRPDVLELKLTLHQLSNNMEVAECDVFCAGAKGLVSHNVKGGRGFDI